MAKRVLLLAYMFPPILDGGAFRPLAFARYLPDFGYEPVVLTRPDTGNLPLDPSQLDKLLPCVRVERVPAGFADGWTDHFRRRFAWLRPVEAVLGQPRGWIADGVAWRISRGDEVRRWEIAWMRPAISVGLELIERYRPDAILATAPPFETLKAGLELHHRTGVPLVADFRDPWTYGVLWNPASAKRARVELAWEQRVIHAASKVIVVTPSMQRTMIESYPDSSSKIELVMNGYEDLSETDASPPEDRFVLSYIGAVMERRLPAVLFEALRRLRSGHPDVAASVRLRLIGPNLDTFSPADRIRGEGLSDMVEWLGAVSHKRSRELMRSSHVLLHIESTATYAVSGKLFEYLAAGRPVLGMTPPGSDDEWFLHQSGAGMNVGLDDADRIAAAIHAKWQEWRRGQLAVIIDPAWLGQFHRREQTRKLAGFLDEIADPQHESGGRTLIGSAKGRTQ